MQVVIDIPDGYVGVIASNQRMEGSAMDKLIRQAIIDGIVLPKGHGDLIDRDKFKPLMDEYFIDTSRLHYENLTNAEHINLGIENCLNELDEMEPVIKADK